MLKQEIVMQKLKLLIHKHFGISISEPQKSLFSLNVGFLPRDLMMLVILIENEYGFKFSDLELSEGKLDCLENMAKIICGHMHE